MSKKLNTNKPKTQKLKAKNKKPKNRVGNKSKSKLSVTKYKKQLIVVFAIILLAALALLVVYVKNDPYISIKTNNNKSSIGQKFSVKVYENSKNTNINAVQLVIKYPQDLLEAKIVTSYSAFSIKAYEEVNNGKIEIVRGAVGGLNKQQLVSEIEFVSKKEGKAKIEFNKESTVLLSSATNTNILDGNDYKNLTMEIK